MIKALDHTSNLPNLDYHSEPSLESKINSTSIDNTQGQESTLLKVADCLHTIFNVQLSPAKQLAGKIFQQQQELQPGQAVKYQPCKSHPFEIVITKERIHCLGNKIGEGTYSSVFATTVIPTSRHHAHHIHFSPGKPQSQAIKMTKHAPPACQTFTPEKKRLREVAKEKGSEGIDAFLDTFKDEQGIGYSLNVRFDTDLSHATFHLGTKPIATMLKVLFDAAKGIKTFHDADWIHRDIKGSNLLVLFQLPSNSDASISQTQNQSEIKGAITDFGSLQRVMKSIHRTAGTPQYLDPKMFGDAETTLINQKRRVGIQTKAGDVFALGMTLVRDVLKKFFFETCQWSSETAPMVEEIKNCLKDKIYGGPFTDEDLKKYAKNAPYRIIHGFNHKTKREFLVEYPTLDFLERALLEVASKLAPLLREGEIRALTGLIKLACRMQHPDLDIRPPISKVMTELTMLGRLIDDSSAKLIKRTLLAEFDEDIEQEIQKRARTEPALEISSDSEECAPTQKLLSNLEMGNGQDNILAILATESQ
jgi:serine/threonine protein kinase